MRVQWTKTGDPAWYKEGGVSSWGFGVEVDNYAELHDNGDELVPVADGWSLRISLGPWALIVYNEAGFHAIYGRDVEYFKKFSVLTP